MDDVQGSPGHFPGKAFGSVATVSQRFRDYVAASVGIVALTLGAMALVVGRVELGVTLRQEGDRVVVDWVASNSPAARQGLEPGMVLLHINGHELIRLPQHVCPDVGEDCSDELGNDVAPVLEPLVPTVETHLRRLFERFGIASRTELASRALREGWLDIPPA
jgi:hypothetical protein